MITRAFRTDLLEIAGLLLSFLCRTRLAYSTGIMPEGSGYSVAAIDRMVFSTFLSPAERVKQEWVLCLNALLYVCGKSTRTE